MSSREIIKPEEVCKAKTNYWEFCEDRITGDIDFLKAMAAGKDAFLFMEVTGDMYVATQPNVRYESDPDWIAYPVRKQHHGKYSYALTSFTGEQYALIGVGNLSTTVASAFNGMLPTPEETKDLVFNPRAVDGKILTEGGREMHPEEPLFFEIKTPEKWAEIDEILAQFSAEKAVEK